MFECPLGIYVYTDIYLHMNWKRWREGKWPDINNDKGTTRVFRGANIITTFRSWLRTSIPANNIGGGRTWELYLPWIYLRLFCPLSLSGTEWHVRSSKLICFIPLCNLCIQPGKLASSIRRLTKFYVCIRWDYRLGWLFVI